MRNRARLEKIERNKKAGIQAHAVLEPGSELTPETRVHYWRDNTRLECTVAEFERSFPGGELVVLRLKYVN